MYLFIDPISTPVTYILFDTERDIISQKSLELRGRESEYFLISLQEFLTENSLEYKNLKGVIAVNGPGSFTAMRIITLTINTLSFVHHIPLYSIDYFQLGILSGWAFPILLRANRGEYLIQRDREAFPVLIAISDILPGNYFGMGDVNDFTNDIISIQSDLKYDVCCKNFLLENPTERIEPIYIKKPNIT
ncbi:MAG: hypothetical protein WC774_00710 [Candidatus Gracilibacteria bacterium]